MTVYSTKTFIEFRLPFQQLDTRHLRIDALPVAMYELNGNTFQSTGRTDW
jgi:hypothetical protein